MTAVQGMGKLIRLRPDITMLIATLGSPPLVVPPLYLPKVDGVTKDKVESDKNAAVISQRNQANLLEQTDYDIPQDRRHGVHGQAVAALPPRAQPHRNPQR